MKMTIENKAGISLLLGAVLMLATMVLHPSGGNLQQLLRTSRIIGISHSLALLAIPCLAVGFGGLLKKMEFNNYVPSLAFALTLMGLLAGMTAAIINGLALPILQWNCIISYYNSDVR